MAVEHLLLPRPTLLARQPSASLQVTVAERGPRADKRTPACYGAIKTEALLLSANPAVLKLGIVCTEA